MSRQDELLAMSAQQATQQALKSIQDDAATTTAAYQQAVANGDTQNAAWQLRSLAALTEEYERIASAMTAQQRQQAQQQQQQAQGGLTPVQVGFLQANPQYQSDPKKFAEIYLSHHQLVSRGMDPNSEQYALALELSAGKPLPSPDMPLSPNEVCEITGVTPDEYNKNAQDLLTLKSMGHYRDGR